MARRERKTAIGLALTTIALALLSPAKAGAPNGGERVLYVDTDQNNRTVFIYNGKRLGCIEIHQLFADSARDKRKISIQESGKGSKAVDEVVTLAKCSGASKIGFVGIDQYN